MVETGMMPEQIANDGNEDILQESDRDSYDDARFDAPEMSEEDD